MRLHVVVLRRRPRIIIESGTRRHQTTAVAVLVLGRHGLRCDSPVRTRSHGLRRHGLGCHGRVRCLWCVWSLLSKIRLLLLIDVGRNLNLDRVVEVAPVREIQRLLVRLRQILRLAVVVLRLLRLLLVTKRWRRWGLRLLLAWCPLGTDVTFATEVLRRCLGGGAHKLIRIRPRRLLLWCLGLLSG